MSSSMPSENQLWKRAAYAAHSSDRQTTIKAKGSVATSQAGNGQNAILEPSGTTVVIMAEGTVSRPQAAFSLMQCSIDPFSEHFLPDIAWTLDGKYLCALTTHGQLLVLSASGDVQQHWPGPLNGQEHYGGSFPVSFTPLPDNKLCLLCADATVHLLDIPSSTCKPFSRIKRSFKVGRTVTYSPKTKTLLLVGDGSSTTTASETTKPGAPSPPQTAAQPLSKSSPVIVAWGIMNLNRPKLVFASKPTGRGGPPPTEVAVPMSGVNAWSSCMSPDGSFAAVLEPTGGWHLLSASESSQFREIRMSPPKVSGNDTESSTGVPVVTSIAWDDTDTALTVWSDGKVCRVSLKAGPAEVVATGVSVASGAIVAKSAGGQEATEGPLGELPEESAPFVVVEPEWEDGSMIEQGKNYFGTESEMGDRKGNPIPHKFGTTTRIIGWRVSHLQSSPPSNAIANLFTADTPPTSDTVSRALQLAQASGVSPVSVWQQMWDAGAKQEADVARLVESTSGHPEAASFLWQEACGVTASSTVAARALLAAALEAQGNEEMNVVYECLQNGADVSTLDESTLAACEARMALLHRLDSVDTYCAIHGMDAEVAGLRDMITAGMPAAAASFAANSNMTALSTVLSRHACSIGASQLEVLHHLPDALDALQYLPVLQQIASWDGTVVRERELDFLESEAVAALLCEHITTRVEVTDPFLAAAAATADPEVRSDGLTIQSVDEWVVERALLVDEATGLLPISTTLLKGWLRLGRDAVAPELTGLHMMQTLFRHSHVLDEGVAGEVAGLSGRDFVAQTEPAQVQYVLRAVFPHETIADTDEAATVLTEVVAPALSVLAGREQALESLLQMEFPESPDWVVSLVKAELQADCVLFGSFSLLAAAVLRLVNNYIPEKRSQSPPQWATLLHLLDSVHAAARSPSALSVTQRDRWVEKLDQAAGRVRGARILSKHGMHLPACALSVADRRSACGLLRSMLTSAAASGAASDDPSAAFGRIWSDCRDLHTYVFEAKSLSLAYLLREFLRAALLAQQWDVAERYIKGTTHVKLSRSGTALTLGSAARDMFAAARSISASDPALAACIRTLSLRSTSFPDLQTSLDLVNALRVASAEIGVANIDKNIWEALAFGGIFSTPTATSSCASLASPIHSETAGMEVDIARLPEMKRHLLDSALEAASSAPAAHYESLCELVALLYGTEEASLGIPTSSRSSALLTVAESLANSPGGEHLAVELAMQLCNEGYQPAWRLASQLGCGGGGHSAPGGSVATHQPGAVVESVGGGWDDPRHELTAFALAACDEAALPQMLAAAEVQELQNSALLYGDGAKRTSAGGSELSGAQILGLASGCAAVDGVLSDVSQLLQGGIRQGQTPALESALENAAVRCVGLAELSAGDSSTHTCGLSTAATACMLEIARTSGTGSLAMLADHHQLPKQPRQRTQLLQCAVRAAALQVMHACDVEITRELLHQTLDSLVATARSTQHSAPPPGSEEAAATLEKLQGQLESHLRDLELRAALGADNNHSSNNNTTSHSNVAPRGGGFPGASSLPCVAEPQQGERQVAESSAIGANPHAGEGNVVDEAVAGEASVGEVGGGGVMSSARQRDALLELAGRSGAALAAGGDATQDIQKALKLARGYDVDTWWVHWGITQSALTSSNPSNPSDTSLLATLSPHTKQLEAHADATLWLMFVWVLPELDRNIPVAAQWLCFALLAAEFSKGLPEAALQQQQLQCLAECCSSAAEIEPLQPAIASIVYEAACSIMQPFWRANPVPEMLSEAVSGPKALPAPSQYSALQALYELSEIDHTSQLRDALSKWPVVQPTGSNGKAHTSNPGGVCSIDSESADIIALVKLLSGTSGEDRNPSEITTMACESLSALSGTSALAIASFCTGIEEEYQCPLPEVVTGGAITPLALHPHAAHALLHSHPALSEPSRDQLPSSVAAIRALVDTCEATSALLSQVTDATAAPGMHGADASSSHAWLLEDLDAVGANALSFAESALQTAQDSSAPEGAQVIAHHAVHSRIHITALAECMPSILAAVSGIGSTVDTSRISSAVDSVLLNACMQRADEVVAALASDADACENVSTGGGDTEGISMLKSLVGVLDGAEAGQLASCKQARGDLLKKLEAMEQQLGGAAMSSLVMRCAVSLRADLVTPERWGEDCAGASSGKQSVLLARGRAALGGLWGAEEPLRAGDLSTVEAVEARVVELVQGEVSLKQLQALFVLVKDVLGFGVALGDPGGMHMAGGAISRGLVKEAGALLEALNVLLCCPEGGAGERAVQVQEVCGELQAVGRPWAACAVSLVAGSEAQHRAAVARLLGGETEGSPGDSELLENAAELSDVGVVCLVLWGLCRAGGATARAVMLAPVCVQALRPALQVLPAIGVSGATYECALPRVVAHMCVEGGNAGVLVAGDVVAEYTDFHLQLRRPEGLCANLAQYMYASIERAKLELQRRGYQEGVCGGVLGYGVDAELVEMLQSGHSQVQAQLDTPF